MARELGLDLVEVAAAASPPVCRIMDYGKFKYENAQKAKESRKKATNVVVKEMKYRPKIGRGDFDTKTRKVHEFLGEGHKVKVTIMFRGREVQHPELGRRILDNVAAAVEEVGRVEALPKVDGRNMTMVLGPDKQAQARAKKLREEAAAEEAAAADGAVAPDTEVTEVADVAEVEAPVIDESTDTPDTTEAPAAPDTETTEAATSAAE
jgi:translation initiation factor IF-3